MNRVKLSRLCGQDLIGWQELITIMLVMLLTGWARNRSGLQNYICVIFTPSLVAQVLCGPITAHISRRPRCWRLNCCVLAPAFLPCRMGRGKNKLSWAEPHSKSPWSFSLLPNSQFKFDQWLLRYSIFVILRSYSIRGNFSLGVVFNSSIFYFTLIPWA